MLFLQAFGCCADSTICSAARCRLYFLSCGVTEQSVCQQPRIALPADRLLCQPEVLCGKEIAQNGDDLIGIGNRNITEFFVAKLCIDGCDPLHRLLQGEFAEQDIPNTSLPGCFHENRPEPGTLHWQLPDCAARRLASYQQPAYPCQSATPWINHPKGTSFGRQGLEELRFF